MRSRLDTITLKGYKTIQTLENFQPRPLTVLIGPNGAGKSNFISFLRMMSWALADPDNFPLHVGQQGGASKILHDGPGTTREIEAELTIATATGENRYAFRLVYAAGDTFIFADERYRYSGKGYSTPAPWQGTGAGHRAPRLLAAASSGSTIARVIRDILRGISVFQFHNTSHTSRMRTKWNTNDNHRLKEDAANIAPVLLHLEANDCKSYQRIVDTIRLILPFFSDLELHTEHGYAILGWRERNSDVTFDVSQASDGMLRVMALVTFLLQPEHNLPDVLILDEPELGLHPYAINVIGGLIRAASTKVQIIVATQSPPFVDCFEPEDIVVVERENRKSTFKQLDAEALTEWLEEYALSELWEKNVIGGRP